MRRMFILLLLFSFTCFFPAFINAQNGTGTCTCNSDCHHTESNECITPYIPFCSTDNNYVCSCSCVRPKFHCSYDYSGMECNNISQNGECPAGCSENCHEFDTNPDMCNQNFGEHDCGCNYPPPAACPNNFVCVDEGYPNACTNQFGIWQDCPLQGGDSGTCCLPIFPPLTCISTCPNPYQNGVGCYWCGGSQYSCSYNLHQDDYCHADARPPMDSQYLCNPNYGFGQCNCFYPCCLEIQDTDAPCGTAAVGTWAQGASCCPGSTCQEIVFDNNHNIIDMPGPCPNGTLGPNETCGCLHPPQPTPGAEPYHCMSVRSGSCECNCPSGWYVTDPRCNAQAPEPACSQQECGCQQAGCTGIFNDQGQCYFGTDCPPGTYWEGFSQPFNNSGNPIGCSALFSCCVPPNDQQISRLAISTTCTTSNGQVGINTAIGCIQVNSPTGLLTFILPWAIGVGGGTAFILIVVAGFLIMTSAGNPQRLKGGKDLLTASITALLLIIFSVYILNFIGLKILRLPGL